MLITIALHIWLIPAFVLICVSTNDIKKASWYDRFRFLGIVMSWPVSVPFLMVWRRVKKG